MIKEIDTYEFRNTTYQLIWLDKDDFFYKIKGIKVLDPPWYLSLVRAFVYRRVIYLRRGAWMVGFDRLVKHEIGHILGYRHNWWKFNLMHPSGIFRWKNTFK